MQHMGNLPGLQLEFQQQALVRSLPCWERTVQSQGRTAWPGEAESVLRLGSIWQAMPIVNQWPSLGGFNFMVICTDLLLLMGREELRASFHCSGGE